MNNHSILSKQIDNPIKNTIFSGAIALIVTLSTIGAYNYFGQNKQQGNSIKIEHINSAPSSSVLYTLNEDGDPVALDFTQVAANVTDAVVHIKSTQTFPNNNSSFQFPQQQLPFDNFFKNDPFGDFFKPKFYFKQQSPKSPNNPPTKVGQGSGVIISKDGYIVTNNHVIENADDLEVTLNDNRSYKATVIGTDPSTDLALIQIKENNLPTLPLVNSDQVKVGEWVMAVGNPFNLTSTVTAGIVSAKGRNINILKNRFAVESFIQTDAAINPGNSGGALVNLQGGLIGINTAIASPTGAYSGYGFAVPTNIVSKVIDDLIKYGVVQRGVLGVTIQTVNSDLKREKDLTVLKGVYVDSLLENSAAADAGIKSGDVILSVDENEIDNSSKLQEVIARHRPGDIVTVKVDRKGKEKVFEVTLNNRKGNPKLVKKEHKELLDILGAEFEELDEDKAQKLNINGGVKILELYAGKLKKHTNLREGFIITKLNGKEVSSVKDVVDSLEGKKGGVMMEGIYEDIPGVYYYAFGL